jgi:hypothetical protein
MHVIRPPDGQNDPNPGKPSYSVPNRFGDVSYMKEEKTQMNRKASFNIEDIPPPVARSNYTEEISSPLARAMTRGGCTITHHASH